MFYQNSSLSAGGTDHASEGNIPANVDSSKSGRGRNEPEFTPRGPDSPRTAAAKAFLSNAPKADNKDKHAKYRALLRHNAQRPEDERWPDASLRAAADGIRSGARRG